MNATPELKIIAHLRGDFPTKFGLPRQSGLAQIKSRIVFTDEYRSPDALRGIEGFSHIWLLWGFSETERSEFSPTVRPPKLGGNERVGVFATRSPYRPNPIGLSCVRLEGVEYSDGPILLVSGADLMDGTPIYDIKPYLPYADCIQNATDGFSGKRLLNTLEVVFEAKPPSELSAQQLTALRGALENDPRPAYHNDAGRVYGFGFAGYDIRFSVEDGRLFVRGFIPLK